jgi:6-phosphogluconolactonase (cycloisomerase 2 family)
MLDRRLFTTLLGATALSPMARAQGATLPFYSAVGPNLTLFALDPKTAALTRKSTVTLPSNLQYAWPGPGGKFLYAVASFNKPGDTSHCAQAFRVGPDGTLTPQGALVKLPYRPINTTVDHAGRYLLTAYNIPSSLTVHRIAADGSIGEEVRQQAVLDTGIYAHQIRVTPNDKTVVLVTRGNDPRPGKAEDPGALKVFRFDDGQLSNLQSLAPHGQGLGFGPRHLDFAPHFVTVSLERENSICIYGLNADGSFSAEPLFIKNALTDPDAKAKYRGQTAGPIHVHPNGRWVYQTNRGSGTMDYNGQKIWNGGINDIVVWSLDAKTGEPTRIQNIDAHGFEIRTFTITPDGKLLIAASQLGLPVREGDHVTNVSAGLSFYRIGTDGKLTFLRKQDVDTSAGTQFWCGLLTMS